MKKQQFQSVDPKQSLPKVEHEMLDFWEREKIFEKSVEQRKGKPKFVFFDGPPFANGLPHYGHILANALKDAVTRYWTMRGFYVPRVNGWDCHGLPVEYEIEKELKLTGRKDIEKMGVAKFNSHCRKSVFRYTEEWEKLLRRIGRWVDFERSYATLENSYMESIWWVFKEIWKKRMVYEGNKSMHICPRCETPLSNFEVTQGYKEVVDLATIVKFRITNSAFLKKFCLPAGQAGKNNPTSFVAWTTTPWSIPTTMGLAVGPDFPYVIVHIGEEQIICAENRLPYVTQHLEKDTWQVVSKLRGKDMVGISYRHPFGEFYENHPEVKKNPGVWKTHAKDYVSVEDGTGIVTINGAFGEIDMESAKQSKLPIIVNVKMDGTYTEEMGEFAGMHVKDQNLDHKIAEYLAKNNALLRTEQIKHSYPHCWRCDTPLLNYATKAWFIRVTDVKEKLLKNNGKIHWVPPHISEGRFGKWLEGARDWNISRNRFWGCPIPVWQCSCGEQMCIGSLKELREHSTGGNTFIFVRHGEAEQNVKGIVNSDPKEVYRLTEKGKTQVRETAKKLEREKIDMIFSSPYARAKETAEIIGREVEIEPKFEQHLREHEMGIFSGKPNGEFLAQFPTLDIRYVKKVPGGESFQEVEARISQFIDFLNRTYSGKTIVLVTHGNPIRGALHALGERNLQETFATITPLGGMTKLSVGKLPKRENELDLHKPYIDDIHLKCGKCAGEMQRIPEVLDCWFESGSMPYAQLHYPFENKTEFENNFPANFIAEGVDQTRGWFYTLHVLATLLFDEPAFKNCIVNGILLAADGEKLSKRKKNYPDPSKLFEMHGVDSTRMFFYTSTAPQAEDVRFSEKHVEEMVKQFTLTLWNTYSFFVTYANIDGWDGKSKIKNQKSKNSNKLDEWIMSELHAMIEEVTAAMEEYNLTKATRPMLAFVDNLSNWYVRRSRRRFWKSENDTDKNSAYQTLFTVLTTCAKLLAPFMPFTADAIYKNLTGEQSVHLADWPNFDKKFIDSKLNEEIRVVRTIVSLALRVRAKNNIKVRQPLARLLLAVPQRMKEMIAPYIDVILEEINVKEARFEYEGKIATRWISVDARKVGPRFGPDTQKILALAREGNFAIQTDGSVHLPAKGRPKFILQSDEVNLGYKGKEGYDVESKEGILVSLDTAVTKELLEEGYARDLVRSIQELRKKAGYDIADRIYVYIAGPKIIQEAVTKFADLIERETLAIEIQEGGDFEWDMEEEIEIDGDKVKVGVRKG